MGAGCEPRGRTPQTVVCVEEVRRGQSVGCGAEAHGRGAGLGVGALQLFCLGATASSLPPTPSSPIPERRRRCSARATAKKRWGCRCRRSWTAPLVASRRARKASSRWVGGGRPWLAVQPRSAALPHCHAVAAGVRQRPGVPTLQPHPCALLPAQVVALPLFSGLATHFPRCQALLAAVEDNLAMWSEEATKLPESKVKADH